jgi:hypothetical protein
LIWTCLKRKPLPPQSIPDIWRSRWTTTAIPPHARPGAGYLYYHYVGSSSRRKHTCKGSLEAMSREIAWATPVKYIRESMLVELAQRCRHDVPDELRQYPGEPLSQIMGYKWTGTMRWVWSLINFKS